MLARFIHFFLAVCFLVTAACAARVANDSSGSTALLLWFYNIPVILTAARALWLAIGAPQQ